MIFLGKQKKGGSSQDNFEEVQIYKWLSLKSRYLLQSEKNLESMKLAFSSSYRAKREDLRVQKQLNSYMKAWYLTVVALKLGRESTGSSVYGARTIGYPYGKK